MFNTYADAKKHLDAIMNGIQPDASLNKAGYLAWTAQYRKTYKAISEIIRELKRARKPNLYTYRAKGDRASKRRVYAGPNPKHHPEAYIRVWMFQIAAQNLLELRKESKLAAGARWKAEKEQQNVA